MRKDIFLERKQEAVSEAVMTIRTVNQVTVIFISSVVFLVFIITVVFVIRRNVHLPQMYFSAMSAFTLWLRRLWWKNSLGPFCGGGKWGGRGGGK